MNKITHSERGRLRTNKGTAQCELLLDRLPTTVAARRHVCATEIAALFSTVHLTPPSALTRQ